MKKRQAEIERAYEAQWDGGKGSHHPDYDPLAVGDDVVKASRETEELYTALVKNDIRLVYQKIEEDADVNFVFGRAYRCPEGYTPLMVACHRGRWVWGQQGVTTSNCCGCWVPSESVWG